MEAPAPEPRQHDKMDAHLSPFRPRWLRFSASWMARPTWNAALAQFIVTRSVSEGLRLEGVSHILPRSRFGLPCYIFSEQAIVYCFIPTASGEFTCSVTAAFGI